jgi:CDGSH iron-sulfur domain-containing protein 3
VSNESAPPLRLKVMDGGALQLRGDLGQIRVVDGDGQPFDFGERRTVLLCRCGLSQDKPFCDSSHERAGFNSTVRVQHPDARQGERNNG